MWIDITSPATHVVRQLAADTIEVAAPNKVWDPAMTRALVWTWLGLNIAGQCGLLLLLATFLVSKKLSSRRHPVVLNFVLTWTLQTIPACLLLYGNGHLDKQPDSWLCLYNAALVAGAPPMLTLAFFAVVLQVYLMMRSVAAQREFVQRTWLTVLLIAAPYAAFVGFAAVTGIVGFKDPENVTRSAEIVYCSVRNHNLGIYIWVPTICVVAATLGVGVALVILLWRNWRDVQGNSVVDFQLIIRALCFTVFQLFLIATYMLAIFDNNVAVKFMQAIAPVTVFFIFATQPDVLRSWFPCLISAPETKGMVRAPSFTPEPRPYGSDAEKYPGDYSFKSSLSSTPSAMRGVPGLSVSTQGLPNGMAPGSNSTPTGPGLRTLSLAASATVSSRPRPTHSPSMSEMSNPITLRPESRSRYPGLQHGRNGSVVSSSGGSSYSDLSFRSTNSGAPLFRTVDGMRGPNAPESAGYYHQNGTTWRSDAGVLGNVASEQQRYRA